MRRFFLTLFLPVVVAGSGLSAAYSAGTPAGAAREFLARHAEEFEGDAVVEALELVCVLESRGGTHVRFRQTVSGTPVYHAGVTVHLTRGRVVSSVSSTLRPVKPGRAWTGVLTESAALARAGEIVGALCRLEAPRVEKRMFVSDSANPRPAWLVGYPTIDPLGDWELLIDARTGELLARDNRIAFEDGSGLAFNPDPLTTAQAEYGEPGYADFDDADTPELNAERVPVVLLGITFADGAYQLAGPYVQIVDFEPPAVAPVTSPALDGFTFTRSETGFEDVNAYFHIDRMQRHLQALGYTGLQNAPIAVDAHGVNGEDNSYYSAELNRLAFGEGGVDDAEDADVLLHEYGHAIHHAAVGGEVWGFDARSLAEGACDYWAGTFSARESQFHDNWVYNWDGHNEFWEGRELTTGRVYPGDWGGDIYANGTIWAHALWLIREQVDPDSADALVAESLFHITPGCTPEDAAEGLLDAEQNLFGGQYRAIVLDALIEKGLLAPTGSLAGTVTDSVSGEPVAEATVLVHSNPPLGATADDNGAYVITDVDVGIWTVTASGPGYGPWSGEVEITLDETTALDPSLPPILATADHDSLDLHAYIDAAADTSIALTAIRDSVRWGIRAEPPGLTAPEPYEPHTPIPLTLPPESELAGFTFDGGSFFASDTGTAPASIRVLDGNGSLRRSFLQPEGITGELTQLASDGTDLWGVDGENRLARIDTLGTLLETIPLPGEARGPMIAWDSGLGTFWVCDAVSWIYPVNRDGFIEWPPVSSEERDALAVDPGAEDGYTLRLYSTDSGVPQVWAVDPLTGDARSSGPLDAGGTAPGAGAEIYTGLQQDLDYLYFAAIGRQGADWVLYPFRLRWTSPWLETSPGMGFNLLVGETVEISVRADAFGLDTGEHESTLRVFFPQGGWPIEIPVRFTVTAVGAAEPRPLSAGQNEFAISQPAPNPCNAATVFTVTLPEPGALVLTVYDVLGRQVDKRLFAELAAGRRRVTWQPPAPLASGLYVVRFHVPGHTPVIRKVLVVE